MVVEFAIAMWTSHCPCRHYGAGGNCIEHTDIICWRDVDGRRFPTMDACEAVLFGPGYHPKDASCVPAELLPR